MTAIVQAYLQERLDELTDAHDVPGASVAVLTPEGVVTAATGVTNVETGVAVTPDTLFQIGSITKLYTASIVMRLVERGELDVDAPVVSYLPDFRVADETATRTTTLRHLLTHTSGIDGDHFLDTGRGDDTLEKFVASCSGLAQQFPVGASMSYCNAGFAILGRVVEVVTGQVWDAALRTEVLTPLGLDHSWTLPEECLRFTTAVGHLGKPGEPRVTPQWGMPRSAGPVGTINATAEDVVRFGAAYLRDGAAADGTPWLAPGTVATMLEPQVTVPNPHTLGDHWSLGWVVHEATDGRVVHGHDGGTLGQGAALRVVPDRGVAVAVAANGGGIADLARTLVRELLRDAADIDLKPALAPVEGASGGDRATQVGSYVRAFATTDVEEATDGGLRLTITSTSEIGSVLSPDPVVIDLLPVADDLYVGRAPGTEGWSSFVFHTLDDGTRYLHFGGRATARA